MNPETIKCVLTTYSRSQLMQDVQPTRAIIATCQTKDSTFASQHSSQNIQGSNSYIKQFKHLETVSYLVLFRDSSGPYIGFCKHGQQSVTTNMATSVARGNEP